MTINEAEDLGFDTSRRLSGHRIRIGCSQCAAGVIQGVPYHELGCANTTYACRGCHARVERRGACCEDCI